MCRLKKKLSWVPFEAKKDSCTFCLFLFFFFATESKSKKDFSSFFVFFFFLLFCFFCWTSLFSSISSPLALFLLSSRFGGGGGGRFCPLRFEPSVVFSSLSSTRRLENEDYI